MLLLDNFNAKINNDNKMINSTHIVAFQGSISGAVERQDRNLLEKSRKRSIELIFQEEQNIIANPKKEPPQINGVVAAEKEGICQISNVRLCIWKLVRHLCENYQKYPKFSGWIILLIQATASAAIKQTVTTYLPPLNSPVTEFAAMFKYSTYIQSLAKSVKMPYVNVFLDTGACKKCI